MKRGVPLNQRRRAAAALPPLRGMQIALALLAGAAGVRAFAPARSSALRGPSTALFADVPFFASAVAEKEGAAAAADAAADAPAASGRTSQRRTLGSQELLMLPRQYGPKVEKGEPNFPSMSHVQVTTLSATPSIEALSKAIDMAMDAHPLLRCHVEGDGEPSERIDLFQMVRKGEPNPCTFVSPGVRTFSSEDVLRVVDVDASSGEDALRRSWEGNFLRDIDDGSWYERAGRGPLWRLTLHRLESGSGDSPCALVFSSNHAISDQGSVNVLMDQLLADVASIEESGGVPNGAVAQDMPMAMEDSVLGASSRWSDVQAGGVSPGTIKYVADKAAEGLRNPVILPDGAGGGDSLVGAVSTIMGKSAGGESESSSDRRTTVQFRTLPSGTTDALLQACRANGVSVTNALVAAVALTATDFIDGGDAKGKERNYKVLQSLDMRRFGAQLDKCDTVACMAGSNDLMLGPLHDRSGESVRSSPESGSSRKLFWDLAREGRDQTNEFVKSDGPVHAVRVFDFAMTISDMNNLVDLTAKSKCGDLSSSNRPLASVSHLAKHSMQARTRRAARTVLGYRTMVYLSAKRP